MKILGPNDEVLAEKGKLMFEDVTCGQCARLHDRDGYVGWCLPPSTMWQAGLPVTHKMHVDEPAGGCECPPTQGVAALMYSLGIDAAAPVEVTEVDANIYAEE